MLRGNDKKLKTYNYIKLFEHKNVKMPSHPIYFKGQLYRFILAHNEDIKGLWNQDLPARYNDKEKLDNIDKDRKFKEKLGLYVSITREVQFEFAELFNLFTTGILEVIDEVDTTKDIDEVLVDIAKEHAEVNDFSIVQLILQGGAEWVMDDETNLGVAADPQNGIQSMFENELEQLSEELTTAITTKFNHFTKIVAANAAKLFWRDTVRTFNENVLLSILDIMGCSIDFLDELAAAAPVKKAKAKKVVVDDADDADDADDTDDAKDAKPKVAAKKGTGKGAGKGAAKAATKKDAKPKAAAKKGAGKGNGKGDAKKGTGKGAGKGAKKGTGKGAAKNAKPKGGFDDEPNDELNDMIDEAADEATDEYEDVEGEDNDLEL